jgi:hypothetical protein
MSDFPFLGGSFNGRSAAFDAQRTFNLYPEMGESGSSRSPVLLIGTPGLRLWTTLTGNGIRGCIRFNASVSIIIAENNVWKVTSGKAATLLGHITYGSTPVFMASNGTLVMLVTGGPDGYFIDPIVGTVAPITDSDFVGGTRVDFIDGYFVWTAPGTGKFQVTQLYGSNIDGLDFATAEGAPDNLISVLVNHREVWLFGESTVEIWYDSGSPDFPLQRIQGAFLECGCLAAGSVAKMDNTVFWLSTDDRGQGIVQRADGYTPKRVSNHAFEAAVASYSTLSDAVAYTYQQEGHSFYVITFPTDGATWCFDASNGLWHERGYRKADGTLTRHRSNCQMNFAGETLVGDFENGNVYVLDLDTFTDNGDAIERFRICPHITNGGNYSFYQALELFMQTGVGLSTGQGRDPQAMLQWSDDGGYVWSNEIWASIGAIGDRQARVRWRRLGKSRDRLFKVAISDPVRVVFTGASLEFNGGIA